MNIIIIILFCLLLNGCIDDNVFEDGDERIIGTEFIGGLYNVSIINMQNYFNGNWYNFSRIKYNKEGVEHSGILHLFMIDSLDWIKKNTSVDSNVLCWWDYGHMVEGFGERDALAVYPSLALKDTIAEFQILNENEKDDYIKNNYWDQNKTLENIAKLLTTDDMSSDESKDLINQYNISYILTRSYDKYVSKIFFIACGKDNEEYVSANNTPTEKADSTLIFRMWEENPIIPGLELVYESFPSGFFNPVQYEDVRIFRIIKDKLADNNIDESENENRDNPVAIFDTTKGTFKVELYIDKTPITCNNFINLVNNDFYDGLIFHRISDDFMIQGGAYYPDGFYKESPYGTIDLEIHTDARHIDGAISMARANDPNSATSQFFICDGAQQFLDDNYAVFGEVIEGIEVIRDIADEPHDNSSPAGGGKPDTDIIINSITIN
jgi:peptidyl-prolyl cis-trans isomerase A (cyclophilin A)